MIVYDPSRFALASIPTPGVCSIPDGHYNSDAEMVQHTTDLIIYGFSTADDHRKSSTSATETIRTIGVELSKVLLAIILSITYVWGIDAPVIEIAL